jgi:hypothetical protein
MNKSKTLQWRFEIKVNEARHAASLRNEGLKVSVEVSGDQTVMNWDSPISIASQLPKLNDIATRVLFDILKALVRLKLSKAVKGSLRLCIESPRSVMVCPLDQRILRMASGVGLEVAVVYRYLKKRMPSASGDQRVAVISDAAKDPIAIVGEAPPH